VNFIEENFSKLELRRDIRTASHGTSPWRRNIVIGKSIIIRPMARMGRKAFMVRNFTTGPLGPRHNGQD
jgi:hypothetical protein